MGRTLKIILILILTSVMLLCLITLKNNQPDIVRYFPPCLIHSATGYYCPSCGITRTFHSLLNLRLVTAVGQNLLFFVMLTFIFINAIIKYFRAGKVYFTDTDIYIILCLVLFFWIIRNIRYYPFTYLAP